MVPGTGTNIPVLTPIRTGMKEARAVPLYLLPKKMLIPTRRPLLS